MAQSKSDSTTPEFNTQFDPDSDEALSLTVVRAVAAVSGVEATDMPPLFESVDPDALEALSGSMNGGPSWCLEFSLNGYLVAVDNEGQISICAHECA